MTERICTECQMALPDTHPTDECDPCAAFQAGREAAEAEVAGLRQRADKAESLLKEALKTLRAFQAAWYRPTSEFADARIAANAAAEEVLTRARQEGFEP